MAETGERDTMTLLMLLIAAAVFRSRVKVHRPWDIAAVALGIVAGGAVSPAAVESAGYSGGAFADVMTASILPFIVCMSFVFNSWLSMTIGDWLISTMARRRGDQDRGVQNLRTLADTAHRAYAHWIGPR